MLEKNDIFCKKTSIPSLKIVLTINNMFNAYNMARKKTHSLLNYLHIVFEIFVEVRCKIIHCFNNSWIDSIVNIK